MNDGNVAVNAVFNTTTGFKHAGTVTAKTNCWSMLKAGLTVNASGPAELYFEVFFTIFFNYSLNLSECCKLILEEEA